MHFGSFLSSFIASCFLQHCDVNIKNSFKIKLTHKGKFKWYTSYLLQIPKDVRNIQEWTNPEQMQLSNPCMLWKQGSWTRKPHQGLGDNVQDWAKVLNWHQEMRKLKKFWCKLFLLRHCSRYLFLSLTTYFTLCTDILMA
jgi:hypothetical protein